MDQLEGDHTEPKMHVMGDHTVIPLTDCSKIHKTEKTWGYVTEYKSRIKTILGDVKSSCIHQGPKEKLNSVHVDVNGNIYKLCIFDKHSFIANHCLINIKGNL